VSIDQSAAEIGIADALGALVATSSWAIPALTAPALPAFEELGLIAWA